MKTWKQPFNFYQGLPVHLLQKEKRKSEFTTLYAQFDRIEGGKK